MSIVHQAYQSILAKMREWRKLEEHQRLELLKHASSLMGKHFRQALHDLEKGNNYIKIVDYEMFYSLSVGYEKYGLFKSSGKGKLSDCTCQESWMKKVGKNGAYMCCHQIMLELATSVFSDQIKIEKGDLRGSDQLSEILDFLN